MTTKQYYRENNLKKLVRKANRARRAFDLSGSSSDRRQVARVNAFISSALESYSI